MKSILHGILLKKIDYSETSLILQFFTLENGVQSFIFQGAKRKNKKGNLLHPLAIVEITAFTRPDSEMSKMTEVNALSNNQAVFHPLKNGILFFMTEVLSQALKSADSDPQLFQFIENEINWLNISNELTNYPLWFMLQLANWLGIGIRIENNDGPIFDLQEGTISARTPSNHLYVDDELIPILITLLNANKPTFLAFSIHKKTRRTLLSHLIDYFRLHIANFHTPKSLAVLQTLFD